LNYLNPYAKPKYRIVTYKMVSIFKIIIFYGFLMSVLPPWDWPPAKTLVTVTIESRMTTSRTVMLLVIKEKTITRSKLKPVQLFEHRGASVMCPAPSADETFHGNPQLPQGGVWVTVVIRMSWASPPKISYCRMRLSTLLKKSEYSPNNSYLMVMADYTLFLSAIPVPCYMDPYLHHCLVGGFVGFGLQSSQSVPGGHQLNSFY